VTTSPWESVAACSPQFEYTRPNRDKQQAWFELDLLVHAPRLNRSTSLAILVECKYHDLSRYWFFLPHNAQGRWQFDDRVLNCGPYPTLRQPRANTFLPLAPLSSGGIVVSQDGTKQDNAVYAAVQQLVNGFVPCSLHHMFSYNLDYRNVQDPVDEFKFEPDVTALVPMIVTNATLYRLKPTVTDLDAIRAASSPADIADEVPWTWYYYDVPAQTWDQNYDVIDAHIKEQAELIYRFPHVEEAIRDFGDRPNWIAVVNIKSLAAAATKLLDQFLQTDTRDVGAFLRPPTKRTKKRRGKSA
jgi:hypothetical protein